MIKKTDNLNKNKIISRRLFVLVAAKIGLLGIVTSRLYNLQISEKQKYEVLSDKNRIREWKTPPQRGIITDYFNNVIADNQRVYQVHLSLEEVSNFNNSIFKLKNIISLKEDEIKKIYEKKEKSNPWDTLIISENLSWKEFSKLNLYLHELEGAKPVLSTSRYYPYSNDLVHVVGYVGDATTTDIQEALGEMAAGLSALKGHQAANYALAANFEAAAARISDTDFARSSANLAKFSILNQSAMAMVSQANQAQAAVLAVLQ